jgi:PIN domain nuclease of toxin-antitoxin system
LRVFLDTHAFVSLADANTTRFGRESRRLLDTGALFVSPVVLFELHYLREIGRFSREPDRYYAGALEEFDVIEASDAISAVVREANPLAWTRDPFDRLIVATAVLHRAKLVTKDANILEHFDGAVW